MRQWIYWVLALVLAFTQLAGCQKRTLFNPVLAGRFFPLRPGSSWTYQVAYASGARETLTDRVEANSSGSLAGGALVVSDYSGVNGSGPVISADLQRAYPPDKSQLEIHYVIEGDYVTRITSLGGGAQIRAEERRFLPQYLWPDRAWSNTLSPFEKSPDDFLTITQNHRSFLEADPVVVPAGQFANCIRIETEAVYQIPSGPDDTRYFIDWYAPDVGLVKTLVLSGSRDGRQIARIDLLRIAKAPRTVPVHPANDQALMHLSAIARPGVLSADSLIRSVTFGQV
jgi:hypothetical protein